MTDSRVILEGDVMSPINPKEGCRFASRCRYAKERCFNETPIIREVISIRFVAFHYTEEINDLSTESVPK
jgi:oligopeptide/dipeptide ABC transporter ATP-binding protein